MSEPTILIVPGLRDAVAEHWQTLLEPKLARVRSVPPMGRADLNCLARVEAIQRAAEAVDGPLLIVAHSGGCIMVAHWARWAKASPRGQATLRAVRGALLATPPDFETPMPEGYPSMAALEAAGWLPAPRERLPFRSIVAASRNDPLGSYERVSELARDWGSTLADLGEVGHLNPASGYGDWPQASSFIARLSALP